ncbi:MAG: type II toxin-antitoxin system VapC family toxin [Treponema sp.]|nr:type II toxin-antitoxin system VapC family toxin [Treponema sp.]
MFMLDSRVFLCSLDTSLQTISRPAETVLKNAGELFISMASLWKIAEKISEGKLTVPFEPSEFMRICAARAITVLPITPSELDVVKKLSPSYGDVFDRMVAATALTHDYTIVTNNPAFAHFGVPTLY